MADKHDVGATLCCKRRRISARIVILPTRCPQALVIGVVTEQKLVGLNLRCRWRRRVGRCRWRRRVGTPTFGVVVAIQTFGVVVAISDSL